MNLIDPVEWLHIVMSVLCRKPYDLESDYLPYLLLYKRTYQGCHSNIGLQPTASSISTYVLPTEISISTYVLPTPHQNKLKTP